MKKNFIYLSLLRGKAKEDLEGHYSDWIQNTAQYKAMVTDGLIPASFSLPADFTPDTTIVEVSNNQFLVFDIVWGKGKNFTNLNHVIDLAKIENLFITLHDISALGNNLETIQTNYIRLIDANIPIYIPNHADNNHLSTAIKIGNYQPDYKEEHYKSLILSLSESHIKKWRGYGTETGYTQQFLDAYYLHKNFLIGDTEALLLSGLSINIFAKKWKQLENEPYKPYLHYRFPEDSPTEVGIYMLLDLDECWHEYYQKLTGYDVTGYYKLPRRCGRIPEYIKTYQHALLSKTADLSTPITADELKRLLSMEITPRQTMDLHKKFDIPLLMPEILKCYFLREKAANEKDYQKYLSDRYDSSLCEAIRKSFSKNADLSQDRASFLNNYIKNL